MSAELHRKRIGPSAAPGGLWVRVCTLDRLLTEYAAVDPQTVGCSAAADAAIVNAQDEKVWTYFYDGDTGECLRTLITEMSDQNEGANTN